ncbi:MAG: hypothetical protein NVSMB5_11060 [Candidatus Velthaea sp.]
MGVDWAAQTPGATTYPAIIAVDTARKNESFKAKIPPQVVQRLQLVYYSQYDCCEGLSAQHSASELNR